MSMDIRPGTSEHYPAPRTVEDNPDVLARPETLERTDTDVIVSAMLQHAEANPATEPAVAVYALTHLRDTEIYKLEDLVDKYWWGMGDKSKNLAPADREGLVAYVHVHARGIDRLQTLITALQNSASTPHGIDAFNKWDAQIKAAPLAEWGQWRPYLEDYRAKQNGEYDYHHEELESLLAQETTFESRITSQQIERGKALAAHLQEQYLTPIPEGMFLAQLRALSPDDACRVADLATDVAMGIAHEKLAETRQAYGVRRGARNVRRQVTGFEDIKYPFEYAETAFTLQHALHRIEQGGKEEIDGFLLDKRWTQESLDAVAEAMSSWTETSALAEVLMTVEDMGADRTQLENFVADTMQDRLESLYRALDEVGDSSYEFFDLSLGEPEKMLTYLTELSLQIVRAHEVYNLYELIVEQNMTVRDAKEYLEAADPLDIRILDKFDEWRQKWTDHLAIRAHQEAWASYDPKLALTREDVQQIVRAEGASHPIQESMETKAAEHLLIISGHIYEYKSPVEAREVIEQRIKATVPNNLDQLREVVGTYSLLEEDNPVISAKNLDQYGKKGRIPQVKGWSPNHFAMVLDYLRDECLKDKEVMHQLMDQGVFDQGGNLHLKALEQHHLAKHTYLNAMTRGLGQLRSEVIQQPTVQHAVGNFLKSWRGVDVAAPQGQFAQLPVQQEYGLVDLRERFYGLVQVTKAVTGHAPEEIGTYEDYSPTPELTAEISMDNGQVLAMSLPAAESAAPEALGDLAVVLAGLRQFMQGEGRGDIPRSIWRQVKRVNLTRGGNVAGIPEDYRDLIKEVIGKTT